MAAITLFTNQEKATHQSHKFAFSLKPTNYGYWKQMLEPFLIFHNLFGSVDGTIPCPPSKVTTGTTSTDNPSYSPWVKNDAHVRLLITSTISEESFQHVQGQTSHEIWMFLERAYASVSSSHEFTLKSQLLRITMKSDEKPAEYLSRAQEYATALANTSEPMKDKVLFMLTFTGLHEEYNGLKSNLLTRTPPVNFGELHGLISDHDYMITKLLSPQPTNPQAVMATTPSQQPQLNLESIQTQISNLQLMATQLGNQLNPSAPSTPPQPSQAYYAPRSSNNN
ncbi:hypothetical protein HanIR_Chr11g0510771 [Helianthus annuus]|nr:hypothetical protein HanIR_Chr11g0510771 [Helianthus annuus]